MASSIDQSTPSSLGKAVVFLKAPKGKDDPYAAVRHTDKPVHDKHSCILNKFNIMSPDISLV